MNQAVPPPPIQFIDLGAQRRRLGTKIDEAVARVIDSAAFIMGPEVGRLESDLAAFCGAKHVVSCASGTDALALVLMAKEVRPGDAILCPSFTFAATAEVVAWLGATPVFVDVHEDTFNIDPASLEAALKTARAKGLNPVGVIAVDLFGQPADYGVIVPFCEREGLWLLDDAAQGWGGTYKGRRIGTFGAATATSFFPAKPLGCYGDGGAIFTDDAELDSVLRSLRVHGQGADKYDNVRIGMTGRLDTIQAAVLIEKLKIFEDEIAARNKVAGRYNEGLAEVAAVPFVLEDCVSTWAQYTIRVAPERRDALAATLKTQGIPTAIYYPRPLHQQTAYKAYPVGGNGLPVSDRIAREVISLPMHPYLDETTQERIMGAVRAALA
ncbi:MAG TPA: DegT/DnrJ/EryC1/StrS family aminotransferase [Enterovirga sp.]|nr:DegT/DnrJ/EryC1/StrS family aminotransferase [Enterovirga sp.]